jgi:hypothetical protein
MEYTTPGFNSLTKSNQYRKNTNLNLTYYYFKSISYYHGFWWVGVILILLAKSLTQRAIGDLLLLASLLCLAFNTGDTSRQKFGVGRYRGQ